jgi:hypothetical protein
MDFHEPFYEFSAIRGDPVICTIYFLMQTTPKWQRCKLAIWEWHYPQIVWGAESL